MSLASSQAGSSTGPLRSCKKKRNIHIYSDRKSLFYGSKMMDNPSHGWNVWRLLNQCLLFHLLTAAIHCSHCNNFNQNECGFLPLCNQCLMLRNVIGLTVDSIKSFCGLDNLKLIFSVCI